jgi:hypothetical protein
MKKKSLIDDYLQKYSVGNHWELVANDTEDISQVVVIPAYAEKEMIFNTLASLAQNQSSSLKHSFILCVVNNKNSSPDMVKENNRQTMECLRALIKNRNLKPFSADKEIQKTLQCVIDGRLKLGYIDATSTGFEIPEKAGGVGMARKIGMDMALRLLQNSEEKQKIILSLDADTLVQNNYLQSVKDYFIGNKKIAVISYEHQEPQTNEERAAIYCYEIFLRYWIMGLKYAKSPYAFHSIGSAMACSNEAYLTVRGMNKREAGEDFYFLNKLAKIGKIGEIKNTRVYPSPRASLRVPFGTGKRIQRFLAGNHDEYVLYNPQIFEILSSWLKLMNTSLECGEKEILKKAGQISPALEGYLKNCHFSEIWSKIRMNSKDEKRLIYQFHGWFDGFKTLKLINYLSQEAHPLINMFIALENILKMSEENHAGYIFPTKEPDLNEQKNILQYLRKIT